MPSKQTFIPPESLLPDLKGPPLSVLIALATHGPQSRDELARRSGWGPPTVGKALDFLEVRLLVKRHHYRSWALADGVNALGVIGFPTKRKPAAQASSGMAAPAGASNSFSTRDEVRTNRHSQRQRNGLSAESVRNGVLAERQRNGLSAERQRNGLSAESGSRTLSAPQSVSHYLSEAGWAPDDFSARRSANSLSAAGYQRNDFSGPPATTVASREKQSRIPSYAESEADELSGLYDDDGYIYDPKEQINHQQHQHHHQASQAQHEGHDLVRALHSLDPPFDDAASWLRTVPRPLVAAWLRHLEELDRHSRREIRNEAAFIRFKVAAGQPPPPPRRRGRAPCPDCGKVYFDADGLCLVCAGVVTI